MAVYSAVGHMEARCGARGVQSMNTLSNFESSPQLGVKMDTFKSGHLTPAMKISMQQRSQLEFLELFPRYDLVFDLVFGSSLLIFSITDPVFPAAIVIKVQ